MRVEASEEFRKQPISRFAFRLGIAAALLALIPALIGILSGAPDRPYLGIQYNTDDHMVYAAWMRQAMDGRLLFDNRFTTDTQPGLTIHLLFLVLGWFAKLVGIPLAWTIARSAFAVLFVVLLGKLLWRSKMSIFAAKAALTLSVISGGIGFLVWQNFGNIVHPDASQFAKDVALGRLPTDIWQPEGTTFPSMLTSALFMASLCLIIWILISVIDAKSSWKPVLGGGVACLLLMNIHSYDVLLIGFVLVAFLAGALAARQVNWQWIIRVFVMMLGALPAALWFGYVLQNDPVFQARADTPTYSPNFRQVIAAYLPVMLLTVYGLFRKSREKGHWNSLRVLAGSSLVIAIASGWVIASSHVDGYWMSLPVWLAVFGGGVAIVALFGLSTRDHESDPVTLLIFAWAIVGLIAPYFPALFERKLMMGLSIPWSILAALEIEKLGTKMERGTRNLATAFFLILLFATPLRWLFREIDFIRKDVSNTTMHPVFLSRDSANIVNYLTENKRDRTVVIAMPGINRPTENPDIYDRPAVADLNPILSGLAGVYTYAGHWSETPDYSNRRNELYESVYLMPDRARRMEFYRRIGANYVIDVSAAGLGNLPLVDISGDGEVVVDGSRFRLIRLNR